MATTSVLIATAALAAAAPLALLLARAREASKIQQALATLEDSATPAAAGPVDFASFADLPRPVERYFRHVLTDGQGMIKAATTRQSGMLRTGTAAERWLRFTAIQVVVPAAVGFVWNARVAGLPLAAHLRVVDSYIAGTGHGRVSLLSAFPVASDEGSPELNSGALHRYLAEAVWFPTALLPRCGVKWDPIDDHAALATLADRGTTVSLEFRFNEAGEVTGIYSTGRFGRFAGEYRKVPWEGRFRDYHECSGMRVPRYGEVGWHDDGALQLVWKGHLTEAQYDLATHGYKGTR